jgi:hypothetical protein
MAEMRLPIQRDSTLGRVLAAQDLLPLGFAFAGEQEDKTSAADGVVDNKAVASIK